jgi:hypothetical protein
MSDATPHVYVWDITGGACGASRDRDHVMAVVGNELATAEPGTTAVVAEMLVSQDSSVGYIPVQITGRAERTEQGVVWNQTAAGPRGGSPAAHRP